MLSLLIIVSPNRISLQAFKAVFKLLVKIEEFIHHKGPILCEFKIKKDICLPLVGPGKALDDMILPGEVTFDTIKIDGGEIPG